MKRSSQRTATVADHAALGQVGTPHRLPTSGQSNCFTESAATIVVNTMAALRTAVNTADPGDQILIAPGVYAGGTMTFNRDGTTANPIVVRPEDGLGTVTITNAAWTIANTASRLVFEKLHFQGGGIVLMGDHNRISRCRFREFGGSAIRMETARDCRIDHCDFSNTQAGHCINPRGAAAYGAGTAARNLIDYCYFHDTTGSTSADTGVAIYGFGDGGLTGHNVARGQSLIIDHCRFDNINHNGEFVVNKVGGIIWRYCTFDDINGYFQFRTGAHFEVRSCWFEALEDLHLWSEDNLFIGNRLVGGLNAWVPCGNGSWVDQQSGAVPTNRYEPSTNSTFIGNRLGTGRLQVGAFWPNNANPVASLPARNTLLEANTRDGGGNAHEFINTFVNPGHVNTTVRTTTNQPFVAAVKLTAADVGLLADDPLCPLGP
jgi:hypothetical protein